MLKVKATKKKKEIKIFGNRDPRGSDNNIEIWIDENDNLHIRVEKPSMRCYPFKELIEKSGYVEIIQG